MSSFDPRELETPPVDPTKPPRKTKTAKVIIRRMVKPVEDRGVRYECITFVCPGCKAGGPPGYEAVHSLPVNTIGIEPSWDWDGNIDAPTLNPSILTTTPVRCHGYLRAGIFEFLNDSEHPLAGKKVPMVNLPDWVVNLDER